MHKFITGTFKFLKNFVYFFRIVTVFCILMLLLYWIQNLIGANWAWIGFIKPFLDGLLKLANSIYSVTFDFLGATFEFKYVSAIVILLVANFALKLVEFGLCCLEGLYNSGRFLCKRAEEVTFNKSMKTKIEHAQKAITSYYVVINTYEKPKNPYDKSIVNMQEQNDIMNKFIYEQLGVTPKDFDGGFVYKFDNFEKIDSVLDVFFRVIKSKAPINYSVCVNIVSDNPVKDGEILKKLNSLQYLGKIYMSAETALRYDYNRLRNYKLEQIGIYQYNKSTIDVYEFEPNL